MYTLHSAFRVYTWLQNERRKTLPTFHSAGRDLNFSF